MDKVATNKQNKQQQTTIFSAKKKNSEPNFTKSEGKVLFGQIFYENDPLDEPKRMPPSKKFCFFQEVGKNAKRWAKSNLPLSHSQDRKNFPFKKGFKKHPWIASKGADIKATC